MKSGCVRAQAPFANAPRRFAGLMFLLAASPAPHVLAQTADPSIIGVTTVNVDPGAADKTVELLQVYRAAALRQAGNGEVLVLREINWPNRFVMYESWKGQANYDDNEGSPQTLGLREALRLLEGSIDRRNYHVISKAPPKPAAAGALYAVLHLDVFPPGLPAKLEAGREVSATARVQDGNLRYEVTQQVNPPISHTNFLSAWTNLDAYNAYQNSKYARQFRETVGPLLGSPFDERVYEPVR